MIVFWTPYKFITHLLLLVDIVFFPPAPNTVDYSAWAAGKVFCLWSDWSSGS